MCMSVSKIDAIREEGKEIVDEAAVDISTSELSTCLESRGRKAGGLPCVQRRKK